MITHAESPIKHVAIKPSRMRELSAAMLRSNTVLKERCDTIKSTIALLKQVGSRRFGDNIRELRDRLFLEPGNRDRIKPADLLISPEEFAAIEVLRELPSEILDQRFTYKLMKSRLPDFLRTFSSHERDMVEYISQNEQLLLAGWANLVCDLAEKLIARCGQVVDQDDLIQVGFTALSDAIWSYSRSNVLFKTHAYNCVFRRMIITLTKGYDFGKVSKGSERLLASYYKSLLKNAEDASFEAVVSRAIYRETDGKERPLTEKEVAVLNKILTRFVRSEDFGDEEDRSGLSELADNVDDGLDFERMSFDELVARADLSESERELLVLAYTAKRGYKARWARKYGVSRMAATKALRRAYGKVEAARKSWKKVS